MPAFRWPPDLPGEATVAALSHPKPPAPPPPQPIPDLQDPAILATKRRDLESAMARSGRLSTLLTGDENSSYSGSKLGLG